MNPVRYLPGEGCRYWIVGNCLYEEHLNPGLRKDFVCSVLSILEERFDAFVVRGEILGLTSEEAGRIWERRMAGSLNIGWNCAQVTPMQDNPDDVLCQHFLEGVCVLRLPACCGRCRRYMLPER